ncbi:MAG: flavin reductase family protein [Ideonella sp.]|nr:flavin reductase family protein [Ideonella sp.]MCC7456823.1 flavin reductase family protein [Nitrospira sp.]
MHYDARTREHGLKHDPFKALVAPRPIGWIGSLDAQGRANLAPYSFFNAVGDRPPMVMFSSGGHKDSLRNIAATGEFTCSLATWALRDAMNLSSAAVAPQVDEFALAGLQRAPSRFVAAPRVAASPAALECRLWKMLPLPAPAGHADAAYTVVFGEVIGVYIDDAYIRDGIVQTGAMRPIARMGYMEYAAVSPEAVFSLNRPLASADGLGAERPAEWDGVYR